MEENKIINLLASQIQISKEQCKSVIQLLDGGATIPFISRYRKEATGNLDETEIEKISLQFKKLQEITKRKELILETIKDSGKLTPELQKAIDETWDAQALEDIYLPYKPRKKTKGDIAKEKGLEPLAASIMGQNLTDVESYANKFLKHVNSIEEALEGAQDIMAEWINERPYVRNGLRYLFKNEALIETKLVKGKEEEGVKFKDYFSFSEPIKKIPSHRILAIFRAEQQKIIRLKIKPEKEKAIEKIESAIIKSKNSCTPYLQAAAKDSYKRLLQPSLGTEFKNELKEKADESAVTVFAENLRQLLLASPLGTKRILAIDPGFRTGCKVVCLDENGKLLHNETIYPHPPQNQTNKAASKIRQLANAYKIQAIAIGNGTAGRETEDFIRYKIKFDANMEAYVVNEAGASIYSASKVAREEFPQYDVTVRGSVSIGRRLMDPLAELVKIDPKSIGVGQYQHDVNQTLLQESLDRVVESCVNKVGVHLNTASKHLLAYVSGIGPKLAENIVAYRDENGAFTSRLELKKVKGLGEKAFEQASGFLRIPKSKNPLDNSAIHPERYELAKKMVNDIGIELSNIVGNKEAISKINIEKYVDKEVGLLTLKDMLAELQKPGRDPRGKAKQFSFDKNIRTIADLTEGMTLTGIVSNITKFGAFVDLGVKQDGLVHISQLANRFVSDPNEVVKLGQEVKVKVVEVDESRKRIQLSMKDA